MFSHTWAIRWRKKAFFFLSPPCCCLGASHSNFILKAKTLHWVYFVQLVSSHTAFRTSYLKKIRRQWCWKHQTMAYTGTCSCLSRNFQTVCADINLASCRKFQRGIFSESKNIMIKTAIFGYWDDALLVFFFRYWYIFLRFNLHRLNLLKIRDNFDNDILGKLINI